MERPDDSVSRYDKAWQEYADFLEQKLRRFTQRLEETAEADPHSVKQRLASELLKELSDD